MKFKIFQNYIGVITKIKTGGFRPGDTEARSYNQRYFRNLKEF